MKQHVLYQIIIDVCQTDLHNTKRYNVHNVLCNVYTSCNIHVNAS